MSVEESATRDDLVHDNFALKEQTEDDVIRVGRVAHPEEETKDQER